MLINSIFAFLHYIAAFGIVCALFYEWLTFGRYVSYVDAKRIQLCDRWYGILAAVILLVGYLRVMYFEKGSEFYVTSPFFRVKLLLFVLIGLLSIYPTIKFIRWKNETKAGKPPLISDRDFTVISIILKLEMLLLIALVLAASLMAKGVAHDWLHYSLIAQYAVMA